MPNEFVLTLIGWVFGILLWSMVILFGLFWGGLFGLLGTALLYVAFWIQSKRVPRRR